MAPRRLSRCLSPVSDVTEFPISPISTDSGSEWFCDVKDVASLHFGALLLPQVKSERLFAYAGRYTVNDFLRIFKTAYPSREFPGEVEDILEDATEVPNEKSTEVLKLLGLKGWKSLEECLEPVTEQFLAASR